MATVRTHGVGNSVSISIPNSFGIPAGKEFDIFKDRNGGMILVPKIDNPFLSDVPYVSADDNEIFEEAGGEELNHES